MHDVAIALITIAASLLTGLLVAWATFRVARAERAAARLHELDVAMADFLSAVVKATSFLGRMPQLNEHHPAVRLSRVLEKGKDQLSPGWTWVESQRRLRSVLGEQPFLVAERVVDAAARLQVLDPGPELAAAVGMSIDYVIELGTDRSPQVLEKWLALHTSLLTAISTTRARYGITRPDSVDAPRFTTTSGADSP